MDVSQEVSKPKLNVTSGIESPIITNRIAETSLVVQDGQTIVIGGLIQDSAEGSESGVPYLSAIPLIGWLFGTTKSADSKTELILFLTPHVIANFEEVDLVTNEMKSKLNNIRSLINRSDEYWDAYKDAEEVTP